MAYYLSTGLDLWGPQPDLFSAELLFDNEESEENLVLHTKQINNIVKIINYKTK